MSVVPTLIFTFACWLLGIVGALVRAYRNWRRDELGPEFEGATVDSPPIAEISPPLPIEFDETPAGRHHHDTVEIVPDDYRPHIGRHLIAAETDTHRMEMPR